MVSGNPGKSKYMHTVYLRACMKLKLFPSSPLTWPALLRLNLGGVPAPDQLELAMNI